MDLSQLEPAQLGPGDLVYAASDIYNDGGIPDLAENALIAAAGTRGVILNIGHLEEDPERELYLVRFEGEGAELGPPAGCWPDELSRVSLRKADSRGSSCECFAMAAAHRSASDPGDSCSSLRHARNGNRGRRSVGQDPCRAVSDRDRMRDRHIARQRHFYTFGLHAYDYSTRTHRPEL
jgi:nitrogen fixation protein NifZ